jgi:hypothetical protein
MKKKIMFAIAALGMGMGLATTVNAVPNLNGGLKEYCQMYPHDCNCTVSSTGHLRCVFF